MRAFLIILILDIQNLSTNINSNFQVKKYFFLNPLENSSI